MVLLRHFLCCGCFHSTNSGARCRNFKLSSAHLIQYCVKLFQNPPSSCMLLYTKLNAIGICFCCCEEKCLCVCVYLQFSAQEELRLLCLHHQGKRTKILSPSLGKTQCISYANKHYSKKAALCLLFRLTLVVVLFSEPGTK